jgi:hypothetical protein
MNVDTAFQAVTIAGLFAVLPQSLSVPSVWSAVIFAGRGEKTKENFSILRFCVVYLVSRLTTFRLYVDFAVLYVLEGKVPNGENK